MVGTLDDFTLGCLLLGLAFGIGSLGVRLDLVPDRVQVQGVWVLLEDEEERTFFSVLQFYFPVVRRIGLGLGLGQVFELRHHLIGEVREELLFAVVGVHVLTLYEVVANVAQELQG